MNYSTLTSGANSGIRDPNTGDLMKPAGESAYYINGSIWYDDGNLNARVSLQKRAASFSCITPCGGSSVSYNYSGIDYTNVNPTAEASNLGYNPGVAGFNDATNYINVKIAYNITRNF